MAHDNPTKVRPLWRDRVSPMGRIPVGPRPFLAKILVVATCLLVAVAAAGGMLSWLVGTPQTHFVSCWVTKFRDPTIPPNPAADRDRVAFQQASYFAQSHVASMPVQSRFLMTQQLESLSESIRSANVILYVATYAIVDGDGKIILLTSDYDPGRPASGLPLSQVLQSLKKSSAKHKLLVLDINWPNLLPAVSGGAGDVAAALPKELHEIPDDDRLVLCSCSPGQVALTSQTMGQSVFGYYFDQALRGAADRYNSKFLEDGRVTIREAARLLAARVDRWAMHNRSCRQTPVLLGDGDDFELTVCDLQPLTAPVPSKIEKYPAWLLAGWRLREDWLADGTSRLTPRLFHRLECQLLRVEQKWRFGYAADELKVSWEKEVAELKLKVAQYTDHASGPAPASLAAVVAAGHVPDPKVAKATSALLAGLKAVPPTAKPADRQAAFQKLLADFDKQIKDASNEDVALAVLDAAVTQTHAESDRLGVLAGVLKQRQLSDLWIETRFLDQLALRASTLPVGVWDPSQASRLLRIVQQSEQAFCQSDPMPWTAQQLEAAAQSRHDAEFRFWSTGYVPTDAVEQSIGEAESCSDSAAAHQAIFVDAWTTYAQTMGTLPWYSEYVNRDPAGMAAWTSAVDATIGLTGLLEAQAMTARKPAASGKDLEVIRRATKAARSAMAMVLAPFASDSVDRLVQRCQDEDARPNVFGEVDAVLATPLLNAADRARLWLARANLAGRFHDSLAQLDYADEKGNRLTSVLSGYDPAAAIRDESKLATLRARVSLDLLRLGGVSIDTSLAKDLENGSNPFTCEQADAIATLWHSGLREQIEAATKVGRRDRLSRIFPPLRPMGLLDNVETNPTLCLITTQRGDLWAWKADRYRYETRDGVDPEFYAKLAVQFSPYLKKTKQPSLQIECPSALNDVVANAPAAHLSVPWTINGRTDKPEPAAVSFLIPVPWLTVSRHGDSAAHPLASPLMLDVSLADEAKSSSIPPRGFVAIWSTAGRTYHQRVNVPALADQNRLTVLLSPNPKQPEPTLERIRLRSNPTPSPYHLYVRNHGQKARTVLVELSTGEVTASPLEVAAGQVAAVKFAPAPTEKASGPVPPVKEKQLPELDGPLKVVVRDGNTRKELCTAIFPVEIIEPRQFVSLDDVRFTPKDDMHNRLEVDLQQAGAMPGPPCQVQLIVDAEHVPGLVAMGTGVFQGKLPANGTPLALFMQDLHLAEGVSEQGSFSLTIDGVPRVMVFDATFARGGGVTTPVEAIRPAMRLSAPQTGRSGAPFIAHLETDYAPATATLELGLGRKSLSGKLELDSTVKLSGGRQRRIGFSSAGKGGALLFNALIADWNVPIDTAGIVGHRTLRARLLAGDGRELAVAQQEVVLGDRPPQGVVFEDVPQKASNKQSLVITASARQSIPEISSVTFFVGKPAKDAIPKDAVSSPGTAGIGAGTWSGQLALKPSVKGALPISAQFTNAAGLSTFITTTIEVTDADVGGGKIEGKVVEGTIPQPGIAVVLSDSKGAAQAQATTGADGSFSFQSLKPGKYVTSAAKPTSSRRGAAAVEISGQSTVQTTIELWL